MSLQVMTKVLLFRFTLTIVISYKLLPPLVAAAVSNTPPPIQDSLPGCPSMCGDVHIPYPFGIGDNCSWSGVHEYFTLTCNQSYNPPRPFWANVEVIDISVETSEMRVFSPVSYICYNSSNTTERHGMSYWELDYTDSPLLISPTRNEFTAIGCNTLALLDGREDWSYYTGCISSCVSLDSAAHDGDECTGLGCCQTSISGNLSTAEVYWRNGNTTRVNRAWRYSPCSYAFIAEKGWYKFSRRDLVRNGNDSFYTRAGKRTIPLVLDWAIRTDGSCRPARKDGGTLAKPTASACVSPNSYCVDAPQGYGYLCNCSEGYAGNPYVTGPGECTNINECELQKSNPAKYETLYRCHKDSKCHDTQGDYKCTCNFGQRGDGKSEKGCHPIFPVYGMAIIATSVAVILGCIAIFLLQTRIKRNIFNKNGGKILEANGITIYSKKELKKITNGYSKRLGEGHFGNVYEGTLDQSGSKKVAVKRSVVKRVPHRKIKMCTPHDVPQRAQEEDGSFINEIIFQFNVRHKNMVQLLGCCLETEIPILVFEFVTKGSLHDALHGAEKTCTPSLLKRLDIAIGSAEALSYMHSEENHKHVHGDIKPANILLDDDFNPKVSDFGSSKLLPVDKYYARAVAADRMYMDPVYLKTDHFTLECDVYSFGVVLLELITGKKAMYVDKLEEHYSQEMTPSLPSYHPSPKKVTHPKCLPVEFVKCIKDKGSGKMMYDTKIKISGDDAQSLHNMQCLEKIGSLAVRCLKEDKEERPTMAEVVEELKKVKELACGGTSSFSQAN